MTRLNFYGYIVIKIEFLDPENLLLDIFHYVLSTSMPIADRDKQVY